MDPPLGLGQFLTTERPFEIAKNAFYFVSFQVLFILEISTFLSWLFGFAEKQLDKKDKVIFKIYDVTDWTTNNYNTHITQYLKQ